MIDPCDLETRARAILEQNWDGFYTRPAAGLYPHQWSWDSAFIAIANAHIDVERAITEMKSLFKGQWANGLLPHIVYHKYSETYFPGPDFWRTDRCPHAPDEPKTSGIVQPPVHATAVLHILRCINDRDRAHTFARMMFPRLVAWHDYLYCKRDPEGDGLVCIRHPWESGQDNSPVWDAVLKRIQPKPEEIPSYRRKDTVFVSGDERPETSDYDRYVYLIKLFYDRNYDEAAICRDTPFRVQDVLFNTLLIKAEQDLAEIARYLHENPTKFENRAEWSARRMNEKLWDEKHGIYFDYDVVNQTILDVHVAAGFSPLYAGVPGREQANRIMDYLNSFAFCPIGENCYAVPSYDRAAPGYSPKKYWRGPIWMNINWLLYRGVRAYGYDAYADWIRRSMLELPARFGFYEYYDPDEGGGHGSKDFSWTAALVLDFIHEEQALPEGGC